MTREAHLWCITHRHYIHSILDSRDIYTTLTSELDETCRPSGWIYCTICSDCCRTIFGICIYRCHSGKRSLVRVFELRTCLTIPYFLRFFIYKLYNNMPLLIVENAKNVTFCFLTLMPWKNVVTDMWCLVMIFYRVIILWNSKMEVSYIVMTFYHINVLTGCLQHLEILEIYWNLKKPFWKSWKSPEICMVFLEIFV